MKIILPFISLLLIHAIGTAQSWSELDNATSTSLNANGRIYSIISDLEGNIYAGGEFKNGNRKQYVAHWNGVNWEELGVTTATGINGNGDILTISKDAKGYVYAAGRLFGSAGYYVAKWDGTKWWNLGDGNITMVSMGQINSLCVDDSDNLYAAGFHTDGNNKYCVLKWNDYTSWWPIGSYTFYALNGNSFTNTICKTDYNSICAAGNFKNSNGKYYVAQWNGGWMELGTSTSTALNANGPINSLCIDNVGNIYAAGYFTNSNRNCYVAKWDGSSWSELGTNSITSLNANSSINSICTDKYGNVYAAGYFTNSKGKYYVAKWNGTNWSEIGTGSNALNANGSINSICTDTAGNIYAAGTFTNALGRYYVAKYPKSILTNVENTETVKSFSCFPNPTTGNFTINIPEPGQIIILDNTGKTIYTQKVYNYSSTIQLEHISPGVYMVDFKAGGSKYKPIRLVKE